MDHRQRACPQSQREGRISTIAESLETPDPTLHFSHSFLECAHTLDKYGNVWMTKNYFKEHLTESCFSGSVMKIPYFFQTSISWLSYGPFFSNIYYSASSA